MRAHRSAFETDVRSRAITIRWLSTAIITIMLAACTPVPPDPPAYWIWASIQPGDAPATAEILLYQGNFVARGDSQIFDHKGVYPHPLKRSDITLVFRLHELPDPQSVASVIETYITAWQRHKVTISGVQLDFDSPSAKLGNYTAFLTSVRKLLPSRLNYSITGLGAWLAETDAKTLTDLHRTVDYVAYQFYVGREALPQPANYIRFLRNNPNSFKVGLLASDDSINPDIFNGTSGFRGVIYFLQR